jgi:hypothetical protein
MAKRDPLQRPHIVGELRPRRLLAALLRLGRLRELRQAVIELTRDPAAVVEQIARLAALSTRPRWSSSRSIASRIAAQRAASCNASRCGGENTNDPASSLASSAARAPRSNAANAHHAWPRSGFPAAKRQAPRDDHARSSTRPHLPKPSANPETAFFRNTLSFGVVRAPKTIGAWASPKSQDVAYASPKALRRSPVRLRSRTGAG